MKKHYFNLTAFVMLLSIFSIRVNAQCISATNYPSSTLTINFATTNQITSCNYAGEYSINSFTATGVYVVSSTGGTGNFITITDNSNNVLTSGSSPLSVSIPSVGLYRVHISLNSSCGTESACRTVVVTGPGAVAPPNDLCSNAILVTPGTFTAGTTVNATAESPAPPTCITGVQSTGGVWYRVVGNGNRFGADLCAASSWDSKIFVYTGSCGAWTCVTGNDDFGPMCNGLAAASVTWCSVPSTTYYILAQGYSSASAFSINITQTVNPSNPTVTATPGLAASLCINTPTTISVSGGATYLWNTGATTNSIALTPTANSVYTVNSYISGWGSSACGITVSSISVTTLSTPTVTIPTNTAAICPGGAFVVTPSGATNYTYNAGSGITTGTTATLSPIANSIYTITGVGSNGCVSLLANSATATVTTLSSPTLVVSASSASVCPSIPSTLSVSGANTYTWTSLSSNATSVSVNALTTTIYTVSGTGTNVCNGIKTYTLFVYPTPTVTINSGTICSGYSFTLNPSGASTYTMTGATGTVANVVSPLANANYTVTGTSANGCLSTASVAPISSVVVIPTPTITAASGTVCLGLNYTITPSGSNGTYSVNGVATNTTNTAAFSPSVNTSYSVTGTGTNGCVTTSLSMAVVNISVVANPTVTAVAASTAICIGQGTAVLTASGANTYTWSTTATGASVAVSPTATTIYTVSGTSTLLCTVSNTVSVLVNPLPVVTSTVSKPFICVGDNTNIFASGATSYTWNTSSNSSSINVNPVVNTSYTVTGKDGNGCTNSVVASVQVNTLSISASANSSICLGGATTLTVTGGATYTWTGANTGPGLFPSYPVSPTVATVYTVNATDANNCLLTKTVSVAVWSLPSLTTALSSTAICVNESATLSVSGASTYVWSSNSSTAAISTSSSVVVSPTLNITQSYMVVGTDANGCMSSVTNTLGVNLCTGLAEVGKQNLLMTVYPNPTTGEFTIELSNGLVKNIAVIDVTGRVVLNTKSENDKVNLNLTSLANGVYYVKVSSDNASRTVKVVKQ